MQMTTSQGSAIIIPPPQDFMEIILYPVLHHALHKMNRVHVFLIEMYGVLRPKVHKLFTRITSRFLYMFGTYQDIAQVRKGTNGSWYPI